MTLRDRSDRPSRWRIGRLGAEAFRNRSARLGLTLTLLAAWSGAALMVYVTERDAAEANYAYTTAMVSDGYTTLLISQSDNAPEAFRWSNCSTLRHHDGVRAVVGLREPELLGLWNADGPAVPVREAVGDVAAFLRATDASSTIQPSTSLVFDVDSVGSRPTGPTNPGYITAISHEPGENIIRWASTASLTSFGGGLSGNAIVLAPEGGDITTCAVLTNIDQRDQVRESADAWFPLSKGFGSQWALTTAERLDSPRDQYAERPSRWYWLVATAIIVLTWAFSLWILRGDLAVFSIAGLRARQVLGLTTAEMLIVALGSAPIIAAVATVDWVLHTEARYSVTTAVREVARAAVASLGACAAIAAAIANAISGRTLDALKDR